MANKRIKDLATVKYKGFMALDDEEGTGKFNILNALKSIGNVSTKVGTAPYNDANTFPMNEVVICTQNGADVANTPESVSGFLALTLAGLYVSDAGTSKIQFFLKPNGTTYIRSSWGSSWNPWKKIEDDKILITTAGNVSTKVGAAPYNDANTFPKNEIVICTSDGTNVANLPVSDTGFILFTYGPYGKESTYNSCMQILSTITGHTYFRIAWGDTWNSWHKVIESDDCVSIGGNVATKVGSAPYNDFDTFPINEIIYCSSSGDSVNNNPDGSYAFSCVTFSGVLNISAKIQIVSTANKKTFIRSCFLNEWTSWNDISSDCVKMIGSLGSKISTAPYNDLNTFPINEICFLPSNAANVANKPVDMAGFVVVTFSGLYANNPTRIQLLASVSNHIYIRSSWGASWSSWTQLDRDPNECFVNLLGEFDNIICIGDSLTWSQVYTSAEASRQAKKTYPQVLQVICGNTVTAYANPGDDGTTSWNRWKDSFEAKQNAVAIIYLGTNKGFSDTLDTDAPEGTDYTTWADTYTGDFAKMIARLKELDYEIILVKPWATGTTSGNTLETTHKVIDECGERFECAIVEPFKIDDSKYHLYPNGTGSNSLHYNDFGYAWFAYTLCNKINKLSVDELKKIIPT